MRSAYGRQTPQPDYELTRVELGSLMETQSSARRASSGRRQLVFSSGVMAMALRDGLIQALVQRGYSLGRDLLVVD